MYYNSLICVFYLLSFISISIGLLHMFHMFLSDLVCFCVLYVYMGHVSEITLIMMMMVTITYVKTVFGYSRFTVQPKPC